MSPTTSAWCSRTSNTRNRRICSATWARSKFEEVTTKLGPALQRPIVGRGGAYADFDNDGDLDLLITANNGPARLLRNDNGNQNDMLRVKTVGTRSNRDGIGAKVTVKTSKGAHLFAMVKTGSSYLSQSELPLTFGLGKPEEGKTVSLTIVWPSGQKGFHREHQAQSIHHGSRRKRHRLGPANRFQKSVESAPSSSRIQPSPKN